MPVPNHSVTLTPEQIEDLDQKLTDLRHNVNNQLSLVVAAAELIRRKPEMAARFVASLADPPAKIAQEVRSFSEALARILQIPGT